MTPDNIFSTNLILKFAKETKVSAILEFSREKKILKIFKR